MKKNMLDFVKEYEKITFEKSPLLEADFLVLSQFIYIKLDGVVNSIDDAMQKGYTLWEIEKLADRNLLFADEKYRPDNEALFNAMLESKRYAKLVFRFYENILDAELEMQFSAVTVSVDESNTIIVFRGTDEYLIGWKEDFNLSFMKKVPGQVCAKHYLSRVAEQVSGNLYVCGHSKGGNFAVYAGMSVPENVQERIVAIYDFDGPGFREEILVENHYSRIAGRVHKIIPKASMVGMLLGTDDVCKVVESTAVGLLQHILFSWVIEGGELKYTDKMFERTKYIDRKINEWINRLTEEERKIFTDTLFEVAYAGETENLRDISFDKEGLRKAGQVIEAAKRLPQETKDTILAILRELVKVSMKNS